MDLPVIVEDVLWWAASVYGVAVLVSDALLRIGDELQDAAERTEVQWDNKLASGVKAFQQGLATVLRVVAVVVPRVRGAR